MDHRDSRRPHTTVGYRRPMNHFSNNEKPPRYNFSKSFSNQKRGRNLSHPQDYQNVKIFNLNPGCQFIRSPEKIFIKINDQHFINSPRSIPEKTLKPVEMESLINDLKEQVSTLSNGFEEERLRHGSTKKRASLDLKNQEKKIAEEHKIQIDKLYQSHENEKSEISQLHKKAMLEFEQEWKQKYEQLRTEYRMLQASFKNYRLTLQEEKKEEWRLLKEELHWEKKREIENAVDDCKKQMEDNFANERDSMRREFKKNLNEIMHDHRQELEELTHKFTNGDHNLDEIKRRSIMLDDVQQELEQLKMKLEDKTESLKKTTSELSQTKLDFSSLQLEFEDRVSSVDDLHRSKISSLTLENADVKMRLIHSAEELHKEKYEKEKAESEKREIVSKVLEEKLISHESLSSTKLGSSGTRVTCRSVSFQNKHNRGNLTTIADNNPSKSNYVEKKVSFTNSNKNSSADLNGRNSTRKIHGSYSIENSANLGKAASQNPYLKNNEGSTLPDDISHSNSFGVDLQTHSAKNEVSISSRSIGTLQHDNGSNNTTTSYTIAPVVEDQDIINIGIIKSGSKSSPNSDLGFQLGNFSFDDNLIKEEFITEKIVETVDLENRSNAEEIQHPLRFSVAPMHELEVQSEKEKLQNRSDEGQNFQSNERTEDTVGIQNLFFDPRGNGRPDSPDTIY